MCWSVTYTEQSNSAWLWIWMSFPNFLSLVLNHDFTIKLPEEFLNNIGVQLWFLESVFRFCFFFDSLDGSNCRQGWESLVYGIQCGGLCVWERIQRVYNLFAHPWLLQRVDVRFEFPILRILYCSPFKVTWGSRHFWASLILPLFSQS